MIRWSLSAFFRALSQYELFRSTAFIVLVAAVLLVVNEYVFRTQLNAPPLIPYAFYWMVMALTFAALIIVPWRKFLLDANRLMVEAFVTGLVLGLVIAVYKVIVYQELWTVFNIIAEPIRTALFGLLVAWVILQEQAGRLVRSASP